MSLLFSAKRKNINLSTPHQTLMQNARRWLEKCCEEQKSQLCRTWGKRCVIGLYLLCSIPTIAASDKPGGGGAHRCLQLLYRRLGDDVFVPDVFTQSDEDLRSLGPLI
jgi:hypothetical protein